MQVSGHGNGTDSDEPSRGQDIRSARSTGRSPSAGCGPVTCPVRKRRESQFCSVGSLRRTHIAFAPTTRISCFSCTRAEIYSDCALPYAMSLVVCACTRVSQAERRSLATALWQRSVTIICIAAMTHGLDRDRVIGGRRVSGGGRRANQRHRDRTRPPTDATAIPPGTRSGQT